MSDRRPDATAAARLSGLTKRFRGSDLDNQISGKSGVLTGVRTLSGIVQSESGREVVFSVMLNDVPAAKGPNASKLAERIVKLRGSL